jgi:uncharacterized C2H2 Zn-finger protein
MRLDQFIYKQKINKKVMAKFSCPHCSASFTRQFNRNRHLLGKHASVSVVLECSLCGLVFKKLADLKKHRKSHKPTTGFAIFRSALRGTCMIHRKIYSKKISSYEEVVQEDAEDISTLLKFELANKKNLKCSLIVNCEFIKYEADGSIQDVCEIRIRGNSQLLRTPSDITRFFKSTKDTITARISDFCENGSNWVLDEILYSDLEIGACASLNGSAGRLDVSFKKDLQNNAGDNESVMCFANAVAFHFVQDRSMKKIDHFIKTRLNIHGLKFPLDLEDIPKFERMNQRLELKINVISTEDGETFFPIYCNSELSSVDNTVNLLLYKVERAEEEAIDHYAYINNLAALVRKQYAGNNAYQRLVICENCLTPLFDAASLKNHQELCFRNKPSKIEMPEVNEKIWFKNFMKKFKVAFVGFYDFECILNPTETVCGRCERKKTVCAHKSHKINTHVPITCSYMIIDIAEKIVKKNTFTGEHCVKQFFNELLSIEDELQEELNTNIPMKFGETERRAFESSTHCHICEEKFVESDVVVRDHAHLTGEFMGAAHSGKL